MILPEDTKAPLSDDEYDHADYGVDDEAGVPFVPAPAGAIVYGHAADNGDHDGGESQPFLSTTGRDIELGIYPPPYSRRAGGPASPVQKPPVRSLRDRLRDAPRIAIGVAVMFVLYLLTHPPHPGHGRGRRPRPGPDGGFDLDGGRPEFDRPGGGGGDGNGRPHGPPGDHRPPLDGEEPMQYGREVECAVFVDSMSGAQRTAEATFAIPLQADELFLALRGPADVGGVQVDAYDFVDYDSFPEGTIMFTNETLPDTERRGPPVLVTVRGEYAAPEAGAADAANSPGWAMLTGSRVCLMLHDNAASPQYDPVGPPGGPPGGRPRPHHKGGDDPLTFGKSGGVRLGVDVSSQGVTKGLRSPLNFKVQVLLPRSNITAPAVPPLRSARRRSRERGHRGPSSDPEAGPGLFDALLGASSPATSRPQMPDGLVPPITVRSDEGDVRVGNLSGVAMAGIEVRAQVGDVDIEHVRAEIVHIKTVGNIRVNASVSHSVELVTPAGSIDLDLSLARSPAHRFFRWESELFPNRDPRPSSSYPDTASIKNFDPSDPECLLQPVAAMIKGNHDHTIVRHSDWEVPCRQLHELVHAMVGNIEVYPHPLFEGPLHMSTSKGDISVEVSDVADPSGAGRKRTLSMDKAEHHGVKQYKGSIEWTSPSRDQERRAQQAEEDAEWPEEYADDEDEGLNGPEPDGRAPGHGLGGPGGPDDGPGGPPFDRSKDEPSGPHAPQDRRPPPPPWVARKAGLTFETSVGDISVVF